MAKKNKETYQDYINNGDNGISGLSGLKWRDTNEPIEAIGSIGNINLSQKKQAAQESSAPWTENVSDVYGKTDFGNSIYDKEITNSTQLNNLEDTRANIQPFIDKFGAGLSTFAGKTLTATAGGLGTLFYGVPKAIVDGKFSAIFDNDLNKSLESINNSIDDSMKVYASEAERNGSFMDQTLLSTNWWTKSLLGDGMSFTVGAVASAWLMGGIGGLIGKAANALKLGSAAWTGLEETATLANAVKSSKLLGGIVKTADMSTKLAVGSMYEGGVEANDFIRQSLDRYKQQVYNQTGNAPTDKELDDYKLKILPTANALFAANVALVGAANLAVLPGVFGKGVNETIKAAKKNIATEVVDGIVKPILKDETLSGFQKGAKLAFRGLKPLYAEGIQEEGGQNFAKNMALDYVDKHYNPDASKNTYDLMNSFGNALNQAYGTIDGWKEIMAGMVIGGFGSPNLKAIGRFETLEDGKKSWNPLKLDKEKSWWTGGIIGEFQDHHEANKRAKEIIDDYNSQDKESAFEYFKSNLSQNQGIAGQISEINHQNALGKVMDEAAKAGDFHTAKNAEQDRFHSYVKSRVDAGYFETLNDELIAPIEKLSDEEFGETFGYTNMSKEDLAKRKQKTISEAKQSIKDSVDAINFVDSRMSFNLGTEEGRNHRNMLIYALATNKSVGKRVDQLNQFIKESTKDKLKYTHNDEQFDLFESVFQKKISELEESKKGKSAEEISQIDENIAKQQKEIDVINYGREQSKKAEKLVTEGLTAPKSAIEAKEFANQLMNAYDNNNDISPEEIENREKLESALQDLPKLLRRKEEAFELYSTAKNPKTWENFVKTERIQEAWSKLRDESAQKIADAQNEEHAQAETLVNEGTDPETIHTVTGADMSTIEKILNNKKSVEDAKISKSLDELLKSINSQSDHKFESIEGLLDTLTETIEDDDASEQEHDSAQILADRINELIESAKQPIAPVDESVPSKDGLLDKNQDIRPVGESDIQETNDINDKANQDLKSDDKTTSSNIESDLLVDAFNHIAWNNVLYDNKTGKFIYQGINPKASKLLQDYTKLKVGQKVEFKVNPTAEFPAEDLEHIKIDVVINSEVVGQIHTTDYINPNRVVDTDGNLERNITELKDLRNAILSGQITESQIEKVGNGRLITAREFGGNKTDNIPTTQALPDKSAIITVVDSGVIKNKPKNSIIINEGKIAAGKGNNFRNGMFVLLPINQVDEGGVTKTKYIAAPLSPMTLNDPQAQTLSTLIELFIRNRSGQIDAETKTIFDTIAKSMQGKMSYRDEISDQEINFNPQSLNGLRNIIKLFTYDRVSLNDDLNEAGEARADKKIFGINQMKNGSLVVSFGTPKNVTSYKIQQNEASQFEFFTKKPTTGPINSKWEKVDNIDSFFTELGDGTENHLKQSFFYHNKALINQTVNVPTLDMDENGLSVKFDTKPYTQFIKENTQTNLRSVDLGDGNYSYTVQRNIIFSTPKVEKIGQPKVEIVKTEPIIETVEFQQKPEVREKPKLQQRRGNGKSIERKKPLSEEDLLPSFSEVIDEQVGFEIKEKSPNLQMDFITYAKLQPNEIKRSLIAMNRNKEIEVKCK